MKLHLWGTDFRRSSSEFRAQLYLPAEKRADTLRQLLDLGFADLVYLATCNRVEFYTTGRDYFSSTRGQWIELLRVFGLKEDAFYQGYHLEGKSALRHLMRVGASLESLVVGESQILGQLKDALKNAHEVRAVDSAMEQAFSLCFQTAKRIRTETSIGEKPVSVATLGLHYLQQREAEVPLTRAVVVGRSPISILVVQWLLKHRPSCPILWVNRSLDSLRQYEESRQVECLDLQTFLKSPPEFSHLFTATASPAALFRPDFFQKLVPARRLLLDFAQPPDIELAPAQQQTAGQLVHLEDLKREAQQNAEERHRAVERAEGIIDEALRDFCRERKEAPLLRHFSHAPTFLSEELTLTLGTIEKEFPEAIQSKAKQLAERLVRRNWHLSREHLRDVLARLSESDGQIPVV